MTTRALGVWTLRLVHPETGAAASGVPVTLLDDAGNPLGHWVSDPDGLVEIPRQAAESIRIRVGLRTEEPRTLTAAELQGGVVELSAPPAVLPVLRPAEKGEREGPRPRLVPAAARQQELDLPPQVLQFRRLGMLAPQPTATVKERAGIVSAELPDPVATAGIPPVDFFSVAVNYPAPVRYGAIVELEQQWRSLGYVLGDLLYSVALAPGDEARVAVLDGRRRHGPVGGGGAGVLPDDSAPPEHPLQEVARLVGARALLGMLGNASTAIPLEPFTLAPGPAGQRDSTLRGAAADSAAYLSERSVRVSNFVRSRRAFGVAEIGSAERTASVRTLRNTHEGRAVTFQYFETLQRYEAVAKVERIRPAILVPFRMPNLAAPQAVRQYGYLLRRALLDETLIPELDRLLRLDEGVEAGEPAGEAMSDLRLVAHVAPGDRALDLWQASCYLHIDGARYTVHFTPAEAPAGGVSSASIPRTTRWIGTVRGAATREERLRYPTQLSLENASPTDLVFQALHVEGRVSDVWKRVLTLTDLVLTADSQMQLVGVGAPGTAGADLARNRFFAHIAANLPYYSAAVIAAGDPGLRYLALSKVADGFGNAIADIIENVVVGVAGNYVAFPLRSTAFVPPNLQAMFAHFDEHRSVPDEKVVVTVPTPGVWLKLQVGDPMEDRSPAGTAGGPFGAEKPSPSAAPRRAAGG